MKSRRVWLPVCFILGSFAVGNFAGRSTRTDDPGRPPDPAGLEELGTILFDHAADGIWPVVSRIPADRIPAALALVDSTRLKVLDGWEQERLQEIEAAIHHRWALDDPRAALVSAETKHDNPAIDRIRQRPPLIASVLCAWMKQDADEAYRAMIESIGFGESDNRVFQYHAADMLVSTWNADEVIERASRHPAQERDLLGAYGFLAGGDPDRRDSFLRVLREQPKMNHRRWVLSLFFRNWGYRDFLAAAEEALAIRLSWLNEQLIRDNLDRSPASVIPWALSHDLAGTAGRWEAGFASWLRSDAGAARKWLDESGPRWIDQRGFRAYANLLAADGAAAHAEGNADRSEAMRVRLTECLGAWEAVDGDMARSWPATVNDETREWFGNGGNDED